MTNEHLKCAQSKLKWAVNIHNREKSKIVQLFFNLDYTTKCKTLDELKYIKYFFYFFNVATKKYYLHDSYFFWIALVQDNSRLRNLRIEPIHTTCWSCTQNFILMYLFTSQLTLFNISYVSKYQTFLHQNMKISESKVKKQSTNKYLSDHLVQGIQSIK